MSQVSQAHSRMDLISEEDERGRRRPSRSRSSHKCRKPVKHHSANCRKHSKGSIDTGRKKKKDDQKYYIDPVDVDRKEERETAKREEANRGGDSGKSQDGSEYISPKGNEPLFSPSSSSSNASTLEVRKTTSLATRRWCLCISVAILFVGVFASAGIYFGYSYLKSHSTNAERVFRGRFRILTDEGWVPDPGSVFHTQKTEQFRSYIHQLLRGSALGNQYKSTEVFLLESDPAGVLVNFNLHFLSDNKHRLFSQEISTVLESQIKTSGLLPDLDLKSLDIQEREYTVKKTVNHLKKMEPREKIKIDLTGPRECSVMRSGYCSQLPYNITSLPNILGHTHQHQVDSTINTIKSVVESGCYPLSYELMCQFVQPVCYKQRIVPPCQAFCQEFLQSCEGHLTSDILDYLDCDILPTEADGPGACISKPGCVNTLRESGKGDRVCDGVVDCPDFSDELYCPYCPERHFHCGVGLNCIPKDKICDGETDCPNGADEKGCVSLAPRISGGSYIHHYHDSGYVLYQKKGQAGKVCAESLNGTDTAQAETILQNLGNSICQALEYSKLEGIAVGRDEEAEDIQYIDIASIQKGDFDTVQCESQTVVRLECRNLDCGRRSLDGRNNSNPVIHGDWPWQVALMREGVHVCDGTLIDKLWVMSTASCFQGQNKAKWLAVMGSVRLTSRAPWEQSRRIVGMVKSGVEGNDIVLLKLESSVIFSDFARPICLPLTDDWTNDPETSCFGLGWDSQEDILRPMKLNRVDLSQCEDKSEVSVNSVCTESAEKCTADIVAGAGLICQTGAQWHLVGVTSWRRGCGQVGGRPRLYDKVSLTTDWANRVISKNEEAPFNSRVPRRRMGQY